MRLVFGSDLLVGQWAARQFDISSDMIFRPYSAIGLEDKGFLIGAMIYNNYKVDHMGQPLSIEMGGVAVDKRWAMRHIIRPLFAYPFIQLRVKRVQMSIAKPNMVARLFAERLGFTLEGIARKAHYSGKDAAIYSMLRHECRWINGQRPLTTSGTRPQRHIGSANAEQSAERAL